MIEYDPFHDPFLPPLSSSPRRYDLLPALAVLATMFLIIVVAFAILLLSTD